MVKHLPILLLLAAASGSADTFKITAIYTLEYDIGGRIVPGHPDAPDQWFGTITTDGVCSVCTLDGGLLSVSLLPDVSGLESLTEKDVPQFDGPDPVFDRTQLTLLFEVFLPSGIDVEVSPNGVQIPNLRNTPAFLFDSALGGFAGTYAITGPVPEPTPEPASWLLLLTLVALSAKPVRGLIRRRS
jgi:hypothetical protein